MVTVQNTTMDVACVLYLVRCAINKEALSDAKMNKRLMRTDMQELYRVALQNKLVPLLYPVIRQFHEQVKPLDAALLEQWERNTKSVMFHEWVKNLRLGSLLERAEKEQIRLICFKGAALSFLYPQKCERISCDTDLFTTEDKLEETEAFLRRCDYHFAPENSKEHVHNWYHAPSGHLIELHTRLWEDYEGPRMQMLNDMRLTDESTLMRVDASGVQITTLGATEHLIYQFFHIIKHFTLEGIGIRYLVDITLFVNRYHDEIDFKRFRKAMNMLHYGTFVETVFDICVKELRMIDIGISAQRLLRMRNAEVLKQDLMCLGALCERDRGYQIMGAMSAYLTGDANAADSSFLRKLKMAFPSVREFPAKYGYVKAFPLLLPVGWIHRALGYLYACIRYRGKTYNMNEKLSVAEYRMNLLRMMELNTGENAA